MKKALVIHYEYLNNYHNKEMGHFVNYMLSAGYEVDFLTIENLSEKYDGRVGDKFKQIFLPNNYFDSIQTVTYLLRNSSGYSYAWIYPSHKKINLILFVLFSNRVKTIIMLDGYQFVQKKFNLLKKIRKSINALIIHFLSYKILYETENLKYGLLCKSKFVKFSSGLPLKTINLIGQLKPRIKRANEILYPGRIMYIKGLDRLIDVFIKLKKENKINKDWILKIVGKITEDDFYQEQVKKIQNREDIIFIGEKSGEEYYKEILSSSLVVMPTRHETMPNVFQDAFFSKRLFLTTKGALNAGGAIKNELFYCNNDIEGLAMSLIDILSNIQDYYTQFDELYIKDSFVVIDDFFASFIEA